MTVSNDLSTVLNHWETEFSNLLNATSDTTDESINLNVPNTDTNQAAINNVEHNGYITSDELAKVIQKAGKRKAPGYDEIPTEVLKNETAVYFLLKLFYICFQTGQVPKEWSKCIINPIPKSSTNDRRDPMSYRGIALAPASYKLFCGILNNRLI